MTQAPTTSTTESTPQWSDAYRDALASRAQEWMDLGAIVLPVIPVELPADRWHKVSKKTGEPTLKDGKLSPTSPAKYHQVGIAKQASLPHPAMPLRRAPASHSGRGAAALKEPVSKGQPPSLATQSGSV